MKVLANDGISKTTKKTLEDAGIEILDQRVAQEHLARIMNENNVDVLLVKNATKVSRQLIDAVPSLKIIGKAGEGWDNVDVSYAREKGISMISAPEGLSRSAAEMVFAHFLSLARFLHESNRMMPLEGESQFNALKRSYGNAVELQGKTLGVIGLGHVGKEVVKIGISLGMNVKAFTRTPKTEKLTLRFFDGQTLDFSLHTTNNWDEFLNGTQFISINTTKTSEYIIGLPQLEKMENGVYIVNTVSGGIDEVALLDFVESGKVAGAALDIFENEPHPELNILMNPALSLSPHLAGTTLDAQEKTDAALAQQIINLKNHY